LGLLKPLFKIRGEKRALLTLSLKGFPKFGGSLGGVSGKIGLGEL